MARVAGRQRAVEDGIAEREGTDHVVRPADAERVLGHLARQRLGHPAHRLRQERAVGGQRPAAEPVAIEADLRQRRRALPSQRLDAAALDDGEDPWRLPTTLGHSAIELVPAASRPAHGPFDGALLLGFGGVRIGAVVEADDHVAAELELEAHDPLRGQVPLLAGRRLAEDDLVVADDAAVRVLADEAPDLEAARVADDRTIPVHEPMDASGRLHHPRPGPPQQVEGIDDDPLHADGPQVLAAHPAHAGARRIGQEARHGQRAAAGDQRLSHAASARRRARSGPMPHARRRLRFPRRARRGVADTWPPSPADRRVTAPGT